MAKRKRLSPARIAAAADAPEGAAPARHEPRDPAAPAFPPAPRRAPIADVAGDAAGAAAIEELSRALTDARREGRLIQRLPLDAIDETYLVRDRMGIDEEEMQSLMQSLAARGQQTAIEVVDLGGAGRGRPGSPAGGTGARWGLISGWRRLTALRRLAAAGQGPGDVLAIVRVPAAAADAYLAMVEENEIRVGLSHYERARIVARAVDQGVYPDDRSGLAALFHSGSRARRSKIGSFVRIVRTLDPALRFATGLSERAGLALAQGLDADPGLGARIGAELKRRPPADAEAEGRLIARMLEPDAAVAPGPSGDRAEARDLQPEPPQTLKGAETLPEREAARETDPVSPALPPSRTEPTADAGPSSETVSTGSPSETRPESPKTLGDIWLAEGLMLRVEQSGKDERLVLSGPALADPDRRAALIERLRQI